MKILDVNILDSMVADYLAVFTSGTSTVSGFAKSVLGLLMGLDFIAAILLNLDDTDHLKLMIKKILKYGMWVYIVTNFPMLVNIILDSLTTVGFSLGSGGVSLDLMKHPSQIMEMGYSVAEPYYRFLIEQTGADFIADIPVNLLAILATIAILIAFIILAIQISVTYIEFYLAATLLFIFIPFGVNKHTSFLAEKAIGAVFSYGVKLMMMAAIMGVSSIIVNGWTKTIVGTPQLTVATATVCASWFIVYLAWHSPGVAAGLMAGAPTISAGNVIGTAVAGGAAAVGGGMMIAGGARALGNTASSSAKGLASVAGAANAGMKAGGTLGAAKAVGNMAGNAVKSSFSGMGQGLKNSYRAGANSVQPSEDNSSAGTTNTSSNGGQLASSGNSSSNSSSGGDSSLGSLSQNSNQFTGAGSKFGSATNSKSQGQASTGNGDAPKASKMSAFSTAAILSQAHQAIPPEVSPQGGISAPIKNEE